MGVSVRGMGHTVFSRIVARYIVVFVGYAADDPPVQYLLEALRRKSDRIGDMFAFQEGSSKDAAARWLHKGVQAIAYPQSDEHSALWETLEAWAERAKGPTSGLEMSLNWPKEDLNSFNPISGAKSHTLSRPQKAFESSVTLIRLLLQSGFVFLIDSTIR